MKKKNFILLGVIFLIILLISAGVYAYWIWNSDVNKNVVFNTAGMEDMIVYDEGNSYFIGNFMPTDTFCESANNTISFYKKTEAADIDLIATINMDINSIGTNISNSNDVYWVVTEGDNTIACDGLLTSSSVVSYGTFKEKSADTTLTLVRNIEVTTTIQKFTIWIWIDGEGSDLSLLSGETIDTNVWTQIDMAEGVNNYTESILNGADPVLDEGMIPVTISEDGTVTTADTSTNWYNYGNKQWANAVLVKEDGNQTRDYYKNNIGKTVSEDDILAYYVWIPRYKYAFSNANGSPESISIVFESASVAKSTGTATGTSYYTHPAFTFGTQELSGIWVGKFETGHSIFSTYYIDNILGCTDENCANADGLIIKPNVAQLILNDISNFFYASRSMTRSTNSFGLNSSTTDSHVMKNSEWGAVVYLSHSRYGIDGPIRKNNTNFITGCGAFVSGDSNEVSECQITYGEATSYPQSTTGNITGIFDMHGGMYEYVMGNYGNTVGASGFTTLPDSKYYDLYSSTQFTGDYSTNMGLCTLEICGGHALSETTGWYGDSASFVYSDAPWFIRSGTTYTNVVAGEFLMASDDGEGRFAWRSVLVID